MLIFLFVSQHYSVWNKGRCIFYNDKWRDGLLFTTFPNTHLLVILVAVEVRLSLGLKEVLTSASFFESSFLNGSLMDWRDNTNMVVCFVVTKAAPQMKTHLSLFINNHGILSRRNLRQISSVHGARCSRGGRCSASHLHWRTWSLSRNTWNRDCVRLSPPWHSKPDGKHILLAAIMTTSTGWPAGIIYLPIFAKQVLQSSCFGVWRQATHPHVSGGTAAAYDSWANVRTRQSTGVKQALHQRAICHLHIPFSSFVDLESLSLEELQSKGWKDK